MSAFWNNNNWYRIGRSMAKQKVFSEEENKEGIYVWYTVYYGKVSKWYVQQAK